MNLSKLNKALLTTWIILLATFVYVFSIWGMEEQEEEELFVVEEQITPVVNESNEEPVEEVEEEKQIDAMSLAMIGDILLHMRLAVYEDFTSSFEPVAQSLQSFDYLIANQESLPVGNKFKLSGYPQFASPDYIVPALQNVGVDMINLANNHVVDKGEDGVTTLFENIDRFNIPYVGAYKNSADAETMRIVEKGDLKVGFLSYTYGTNGLYLKKDSPYVINYIDEQKIQNDIALLKPQVDVTVVLMHWGPEYVTKAAENEVRLANMLNNAGADIVFGSHPHVLQQYDELLNESGQKTHVFYSIGNFFATTMSSSDSFIGGIASVQITKEDGVVTITEPALEATAMLLDSDGIYRVYPLRDVENRAARNMEWVKAVLGERANVY